MHALPGHHFLRKPALPLHHGYPNLFPPPLSLSGAQIAAAQSSSDACPPVGGGECDPGESHEHDVTVYGKSEGRRERVVLDTLPYSSYRVRMHN